jgi:predicted acylesterase/phospholipase RssA
MAPGEADDANGVPWFEAPGPEPGVFHLGLCMAGAVSAGAYTAGVLDFLIEALDSWEAAKNDPARRHEVPGHSVRLGAISGASAGGMCAAIMLAVLDRDFPSARHEKDRAANPLWQAWVEQVRIEDMLDTADRGSGKDVRSLLNVGVLKRIVDRTLSNGRGPKPRQWVARSLPVALSVGNLRGVPYGMSLGVPRSAATPDEDWTRLSHRMRMHGDSVGFVYGDADERFGGFQPLTAPSSKDAQAWANLGDAALASGAFPFALEARPLRRNGAEYANRTVLVPGDGHPHSEHRDATFAKLTPDWPDGVPPNPYDYLTVDGGMFDNEPLDLCRALLSNDPRKRLVRDGRFANRTVLMVDPFPDAVGAGPTAPVPLLRLVAPMLEAWKMQCRYGAVDIALAGAADVFSRMMIAPTRGRGDPPGGHALAAGGLGAFLGFFHRAFRVHDFLLGRRNCQNFLRRRLALPKGNAVFKVPGWPHPPPDAQDQQARDTVWRHAMNAADPGLEAFWPVIPLVGACAEKLELPSWPRGCLDPTVLRPAIAGRLDAVVADVLRDAPGGFGARLILKGAWRLKRQAIVEAAIDQIATALKARQLV